MPLPQLTENTFHHMATASAPQFRLTPSEAELQLDGYLEEFSRCVQSAEYDPNGSLHAVVFGEWGHGKSQVLYRTTAHLREKHSRVLSIRIIPETMTAPVILQQVREAVPDDHSDALESLDGAISQVANLERHSIEAMERAAQAIGTLAEILNRQHTALLFDEVQKMRRETFQCFLDELLSRFAGAERNVHTMQCHSMASLDDTRKLTADLGDWMRQARVIHLPSIEMSEASQFYRQRIEDCGGNRQAQQLISPGVAMTLCEAAGGNPRAMLQLAGDVYRRAIREDSDTMSPDVVINELSNRRGFHPGTRLLDQKRRESTIELLPQVLSPAQSKPIVQLLTEHFSDLYAARKKFDASELVTLLDVNNSQLQGLLQPIDGIAIFVADEDPIFETTQYGLSDSFRQHLSRHSGVSGSLPLKKLQFGLLLTPERFQSQIVDGLAHGLRHSRFYLSPPEHVSLGRTTDGNQLRGYKIQAQVGDHSLTAPILVSCICGFDPPEEMITNLITPLKQREVLRSFVLFYHPELSWSQWITQSDPEEWLAGHAQEEAEPRLVALTEEDWEHAVPPLAGDDEIEMSVRWAPFFAHVASLKNVASLQEAMPEETQRFNDQLYAIFKGHRLELKDVCYLPSDAERKLLSQPAWHIDWKTGASRTSIVNTDGFNWTQSQLDLLVEQFLIKEGRKYRRAPLTDCKLYVAIHRVLKKARNPLPLTDLVQRVRQLALIPAHGDLLHACVEWMVAEMKHAGRVEQDRFSIRLIDLEREIAGNRTKFRRLGKEVEGRARKLTLQTGDELTDVKQRLERIQQEATGLSGAPPREVHTNLKRLIEDMNSLKADLDALELDHARKNKRIKEHLAGKLQELTKQLDSLPAAWRGIIVSDATVIGVHQEFQQLEADMNGDSRLPAAELRNRQQMLSSRIGHILDTAYGRVDATDPEEQLAALVASGRSFRRVVVTVEKED